MLSNTLFRWHTWHANNIPENPLEFIYCIVDFGDGSGKMYIVEPHYAQDSRGRTHISAGYKYFVFFDCDVKLANPEMQQTNHRFNYSGYVMESKRFIAVFDTMEDAKERAYTQYQHHFGYVLPHIADDIETLTKGHFVV